MYIVYIDDSKDLDGQSLYCFSALAVEESAWRNAFETIRGYRRRLRESDGIYMYKEMHASEFVGGRGRISDRVVGKWRRSQIFREFLSVVSGINGVHLFNGARDREDWLFERLITRIHRTMQAWESRAILIIDQGKEGEYTRLIRKMNVYNPIPSRYGVWLDTGEATRNIPISHIIEDPIFKESHRSYFIQAADFCAYALLRQEKPLASKTKYGLDTAFERLHPICVSAASRYDRWGIVR